MRGIGTAQTRFLPPSLLPFLPALSLLPSFFPASFLSCLLPSFLSQFLPSSFLPLSLPYFLPSLLPSPPSFPPSLPPLLEELYTYHLWLWAMTNLKRQSPFLGKKKSQLWHVPRGAWAPLGTPGSCTVCCAYFYFLLLFLFFFLSPLFIVIYFCSWCSFMSSLMSSFYIPGPDHKN